MELEVESEWREVELRNVSVVRGKGSER